MTHNGVVALYSDAIIMTQRIVIAQHPRCDADAGDARPFGFCYSNSHVESKGNTERRSNAPAASIAQSDIR